MGEFSIIDRYFKNIGKSRQEIIEGPGDDAAVVRMGNSEWTICADTMVSGVHFFDSQDAFDVGFKCLAVNLSDTIAMGATPVWAILCLTHPDGNEDWIGRFSDGFHELAEKSAVSLIGGDTTSGPLTVSVTVGGQLYGPPVLRSGAGVGDIIFLSNTVGDAAVGLKIAQGEYEASEMDRKACLEKLNRPYPDLSYVSPLCKFASAAIDISDGLLADLGHILTASGGVGAKLDLSTIPMSHAAKNYLTNNGQASENWQTILSGGDDYILCFCVPRNQIENLETQFPNIQLFRIGEIVEQTGIEVQNAPAGLILSQRTGFDHFTKNEL